MMKKLLLGLISLACFGCSNLENPKIEQAQEDGAKFTISAKEAVEIACDFANSLRPEAKSNCFSASESDCKAVISTSTRNECDTLLYAVNNDNGDGYILVSASKAAEPVLAYVEKGSFNEEELNPAMADYLESAKSYVASLSGSNGGISIDVPVDRGFTMTETVEPRVKVEWGQRDYEGKYCPNGISGCAQTAMAQMLSYFEAPDSIALTYPERDADVLILNWAEIKKHVKTVYPSSPYEFVRDHRLTCPANKQAHEAIGKLCRELGHRNCAIYKETATTATLYDAKQTFKSILPTYNIGQEKSFTDYANIYSEIKNYNGVMFVCGLDKDTEGYAWVCDGAQKVERTDRFQRIDGSYEEVVTTSFYFHFNWGWDGKDNGYFAAGVFDTAMGSRNADTVKSRYDFSINPTYFYVTK